MHPRQLYLTQSGIKSTLKWYEVSLYFADCMHCCFGYINYKCQFSWQKYAQMPKLTFCVFTLMISPDFLSNI